MKKKFLSIFCALLTLISFFGGITIPADTAEASSSVQIWKECTSNAELEAYLGTKYDVTNNNVDKWKTVKIVVYNPYAKKWQYLSSSRMSPGTTDTAYSSPEKLNNAFYPILCGQNVMVDLTEDELKTFDEGYIMSNSGQTDNVKLSATTMEGSKISETRNGFSGVWAITSKLSGDSSSFTVAMKISDTFSITKKTHYLKSQKEFWNLDETKACFGLLAQKVDGHTYFDFYEQNTISCKSAEGGQWWIAGETYKNRVDATVKIDWLFCRDQAVLTVVDTDGASPEAVFGDPTYNQNYSTDLSMKRSSESSISTYYYPSSNNFLIFLPVADSITTFIKVAQTFSTDDWINNWDWEKYWAWKKETDSKSYARMSISRTIKGNYSESSSPIVVYTGDLYIPAGSVWTIPEDFTVIISNECTVIVDGEIRNNGTLIIQPGATVTYYSRDASNSDMISIIDTNTNVPQGYDYEESNYSSERLIYNFNDLANSVLVNNVLVNDSGDNTEDSQKVQVALLKNGIINTGNLVVRSGARVDIPRLSQYDDGKTWLSGTMLVEEIFTLGTDIIGSSTDNTWTVSDAFEMSYSTNVDNAIYHFNIDNGTLYLLQCPKKSQKQLWGADTSTWSNLLKDNEDVLCDGAPVQAILGTGNSYEEGFNIFGKNVTIQDSIKGASAITNMKGYK